MKKTLTITLPDIDQAQVLLDGNRITVSWPDGLPFTIESDLDRAAMTEKETAMMES